MENLDPKLFSSWLYILETSPLGKPEIRVFDRYKWGLAFGPHTVSLADAGDSVPFDAYIYENGDARTVHICDSLENLKETLAAIAARTKYLVSWNDQFIMASSFEEAKEIKESPGRHFTGWDGENNIKMIVRDSLNIKPL